MESPKGFTVEWASLFLGIGACLNLPYFHLQKEAQKPRLDTQYYPNLYLQKEVQKSRSDVERYLNLGWIGVCERLTERDLNMDNLMDLWQKFHSFLLLFQQLYLKLEKILALWEMVLYLLLLYLSFSEFPNRLRPPCTTMPWTIWPALVVLWGVCWMFCDELSWNWGDQGEPLMADGMMGLFEDIGHTDLPQGDSSPFPFPFCVEYALFRRPKSRTAITAMRAWPRYHF